MSVLLPEDSLKPSSYIGLLQISQRQYPIRVAIDADAPQFECDPALGQLLQSAPQALDLIRQKIVHYGRLGCISDLLLEMQDITERVVGCIESEKKVINAAEALMENDSYERIIKEVGEIGWDRLVSVDPSLTLLQFKYDDVQLRKHYFSFRLQPDHPNTPPECILDIPEEFELSWSRKSCLLLGVRQIETALQKYDSFWAILEDFDQNCWVIEPENPTRSSRSRRIALDRYSSIIVDIDPKAPYRFCDFRFLGPDSVIEPLKEKLVNNAGRWVESILPRENLQTILGVEFLSKKQSAEMEEFHLECGICYAKDRDGVIADRSCDNVRCARPFHSACLLEWLTSIPNCRRSFSTVFGTCPYCSTSITATAQ